MPRYIIVDMGFFIGVDLGGTKTAVTLADEGLRILDKCGFPTVMPGGPEAMIDRMAESARSLCGQNGISDKALLACGVSSGGPLDPEAGLILSPPNLPGWDSVPIVRLLGGRLGIPCFLENDANACALAEWKLGAGRGASTMIFLTFGTGMGAGLIIDGALHRGPDCLAGEVGHVRLSRRGPDGYGKRGSFEGFCSGGGIARQAMAEARKTLGRGGRAAFCPDEASIGAITAKDVAAAADAGDQLAIAILERSGEYLGRGLAVLIDLLNPEAIVIGSIFARCERFLRPAAERVVAREALPASARRCRILAAGLGESIGDYAALLVARDGLAQTEKGRGSA
jgi:glucokinase